MPDAFSTTAVNGTASLPSAFYWPVALAETLVQAQRAQLDALLTWQESLGAIQQEMWDEWVARWGGGAPIDA